MLIKSSFAAIASLMILTSFAYGQEMTEGPAHHLETCAREQGTRDVATKGTSIFGVVLSKDGKPVPGAKVVLEDEFGSISKTVTSPRGCFVLAGIVPGSIYHLEVVHKSGTWEVSVRSFENGDGLLLRAVK